MKITLEELKAFVRPQWHSWTEKIVTPRRYYRRQDLQRLANRWYGVNTQQIHMIEIRSAKTEIVVPDPQLSYVAFFVDMDKSWTAPRLRVKKLVIPAFAMRQAVSKRMYLNEAGSLLFEEFYYRLYDGLSKQAYITE